MLSAETIGLQLLLVSAAAVAEDWEPPRTSSLVDRVAEACLEGASLSAAQPVTELSAAIANLSAGQTALRDAQQRTAQQLTTGQQEAQQLITGQQEAALSLRDAQQEAVQRLITGQQEAAQQLRDAQQRTAQQLITGLQEATQSLRDGQKRIERQLAALEEKQSAVLRQTQPVVELTVATAALSAGQKRIEKQLAALEEKQSATQPADLTPPPQQAAAAECPSGWTRSGNNCFRVSNETSSWTTADAGCVQLDSRARLASVHADTVSKIQSLSRAKLWIGLSRSGSSSSPWAWADGSPLDYTDWDVSRGQPGNSYERCALINTHRGRRWHDYSCDRSYKYVCQIRLQ